jgi:uncharacterized protein
MDDSVRRARRGLAIYLIAVVIFSTPLQAGIIATDALAETGSSIAWLTGLMLVPTVASLIARGWQHEGLSDLGLRRGHRVGRALLIALILPFLVGTLAYGLAWSTGLTELQIPPLGMWAALFAAMLVLNSVLATGEEIGWRGYMLPHMVEAGVPRPVLVSSLVWGLWHVPLFLWGGFVHDGPDPLITTGLLMVATTALGYVLGRLRLDSGNVWPAALLHVIWNTVIQTGFHPASAGDDKAVWTGETGILTVLALIAVALAYRKWQPRRPVDNPIADPNTKEDAVASGRNR